MMFLFAAVLQTVSVNPRETIDLTVPQPCQQRETKEDVVVCAKRGESPYRLNAVPARTSKQPKAELKIAEGVNAGAETESADVGGFTSNRLTLRLKLKF